MEPKPRSSSGIRLDDLHRKGREMTKPGIDKALVAVAGSVPALIIVVFAGLLALIGIACNEGRRQYALQYADRLVDLAAVLVGHPSPTHAEIPRPKD
jgi:hypothetical protein